MNWHILTILGHSFVLFPGSIGETETTTEITKIHKLYFYKKRNLYANPGKKKKHNNQEIVEDERYT